MQFVKFTISVVVVFFFVQAEFASVPTSFKIGVLRVAGLSEKQFFYQKFRRAIAAHKDLQLVDDDLARVAAAALKLENPFNLSLVEAKNFGAAAGCNYFFVVKDDVLRRSSFAKDVYFEANAIVFLVSARTGRLVAWKQIEATDDAPEAAENKLLAATDEIAAHFAAKLIEAEKEEKAGRATQTIEATGVLEISGDDAAADPDLRVPLPYKRLQPVYTAAAGKAAAEAIVDVAVELNESGAVEKTEIARWAGFGLDEEAMSVVKKMQFRPALKDGAPRRSRFLLRYNFRRPRDE